MTKIESEIWKSLPGVPGVEISTFGRVRILDRVVSIENMTRFIKGRISKQYDNTHGYLIVSIPIDGKWTNKKVHRLVAQTFIPNLDNLPQVNHKNCDRADNRVENLEWCTRSYNMKYKEKFGISQTKAAGHPVLAINLETLEVSRFESQSKAGRVLGAKRPNINAVIKGRLKHTGGFWFVNADDKAVDLTKQKLREIGKTRLTAADADSENFVSKIISE